MRTLGKDGTLHFSDLKRIAESPRHYLYAVNNEIAPTKAMRIGTLVHLLVLGPRHGQPSQIAIYEGAARRGAKWEAFVREHEGYELATADEFEQAEAIAESVHNSPIARARLEGAACETPLEWEDSGIRCSTSGVDIITADGAVGDIKSTVTVQPELFQRHAFRMSYAQQVAFYRRGRIANGKEPRELFILGVETRPPYDVVELTLTPEMVDHADRTLTLWIERLRACLLSCPHPINVRSWPGYAQSPVPWTPPEWATEEDDDELSEEADAEFEAAE